MGVDDLVDALNAYSKRFLRLVALMVDMHLNVARREANREQQRLINGIVLLAIASSFLMTFFVLLQVLLVLWLYSTERNWALGLIGLLIANFLVGSLFAMVGVRTVRGPYMTETIAQLSKTTSILTKDDF